MAGGLTLGVDWEAQGAEASAAVAGAHAILVTGHDPIVTARVAIGLGRVQSRTRRVAIGDLIGDVEPLQRLVTGDDPHGIVDSFLYGVSLNKIARQIDDAGMLFVMPTGTEPTVTPDIMRNERWHRLGAGFREVGALLILVAVSDAEGAADLGALLDGVVVVGEDSPQFDENSASILARITAPSIAEVPAQVPVAVPDPAPSERSRQPSPVVLPAHVSGAQRVPNAMPESGGLPKAAVVMLVLLVAAGIWYALGMPGVPSGSISAPASTDSVTSAVNVEAAPATPDDTTIAAATSAGSDSLSALRVANPQDSAKAVPYGVVLVATNDEEQALARWAELGIKLPAGTVTMVRIRGERGRFFQMQAGAFDRARQADSLLAALRANGRLSATAGSVKATPYALVLETKVSRRAARNVADGYGQRRIAAYPLLQPDGSATIFVGAFESPEQAAPLMSELRAKGVGSTLQYRTGRSF